MKEKDQYKETTFTILKQMGHQSNMYLHLGNNENLLLEEETNIIEFELAKQQHNKAA